MKEKVIATERDHLKSLIDKEIRLYGEECNLNHLDISRVTSLSSLFINSSFNGNISEWRNLI